MFLFGGVFTFVFIIQICVFLFVWCTIFKTIFNSIRRVNNHNYFKNNVVDRSVFNNGNKKKVYRNVSLEKLKMFNTTDLEGLQDYLYDRFVEFEKAYNNLDYNMMKVLSTKQLYQNYHTGITLDLKAGRKKIISDIERNNVVVYELDSTISKQVVNVMIDITYTGYTLDKKGYVISGSRDAKIRERFEVEFRKYFGDDDIIKCPNCGAAVTGNTCEYCRSDLKAVEFKINSIKKIID